MKKQVALVVAALTALFSLCAPAEAAVCGGMCERCIFAYRLSLTLNTTQPFRESNVAAGGELVYRKPAICNLVGYLFGRTAAGVGTCGDEICGCNDWFLGSDGLATQGAILLWKAWNKEAFPVSGATIVRMNRIGYADRSTVESVMRLTLTDNGPFGADSQLVLAGFGKTECAEDGNVRVKKLYGYVAGEMLAYQVDSEEAVCGDQLPENWTPAAYWSLCGGEDGLVMDDPLTVACGSWRMEWDSQLVTRLQQNGVNPNTARPSAAYEPQNFFWDNE